MTDQETTDQKITDQEMTDWKKQIKNKWSKKTDQIISPRQKIYTQRVEIWVISQRLVVKQEDMQLRVRGF